MWHPHLGHVSTFDLKYLVSIRALGNFQIQDIVDSSGCKLAKFYALPFNESVSSSLALFDLVHSNVWRPYLISTKEGP